MKAAAEDQLRLLDLQALDTRLDQIAHAKSRLPVQRELDEALAQQEAVQAELVRTRTALSDVQREVAKADSDVQLVRDRAARDEARLTAGTGSAKDLQALQHELASLARRQAELEDLELEVMERAEVLSGDVGRLEGEAAGVAQRVAELTSARDHAVAELDAEGESVSDSRDALVPNVDSALLGLYEKIRSASGGVGAAALRQRRCEGCRLELNTVDLGHIRAASPDEVVRCEECRRILVRTAESGL